MTETNRIDVTRACYEAAGLPVDEAHDAADPEGPVTGIGTYTSNEAEAVALWTCSAAHPIKRTAADPTDAELSWIYDYLTLYSAPCLEANGIDVPAPAPREEWVSKWPEYVWFPSTGSEQLEPTLEADLQALCLNADETMAELRAAQGQG